MTRFTLTGLIIFLLVVPQGLLAQSDIPLEETFNPNFLLSDEEMLDTLSMTKEDVQLLLTRGSLDRFSDIGGNGKNQTASEIIWNTAMEFSLSPRFLLTILQREQSLIEDKQPSKDQLDWAMGYGICDDCSKSDPLIQKFRGLRNQIYFAAARISQSYLKDLRTKGFTESGIGPGRALMVDDTVVVPANFATSILYTYTPHINGNKNFYKIWKRLFERPYLNGTLLQDKTTGAIWLIEDHLRRPITSRVAFFSRFAKQNLLSVGPSILQAYTIGKAIKYPNYSLLRSPRGTVYLLVDDERRGFDSQAAFRAMGFSPDEIIDVPWTDLESYREGQAITLSTRSPKGVLLQDNKTGGVYFMENGIKHPLLSREILTTNFPDFKLKSVSRAELDSFTTGPAQQFPSGTLVGVRGTPEIFVISDGFRHPILNEETFLTFGWRSDQIVWTTERSITLHELAEMVEVNAIP